MSTNNTHRNFQGIFFEVVVDGGVQLSKICYTILSALFGGVGDVTLYKATIKRAGYFQYHLIFHLHYSDESRTSLESRAHPDL